MDKINLSQLIKGINRLQQLKEALLDEVLSPEGAWIHEYQVRRTYPRAIQKPTFMPSGRHTSQSLSGTLKRVGDRLNQEKIQNSLAISILGESAAPQD